MVIDRGIYYKYDECLYDEDVVDENTEITEKVKTYTITVDVYAKDILVGSGTAPEECFVFDSDTQTITDYKCGMNNTNDMKYYAEVDIPSQINGVTVTAVGESVFMNEQLTSLKIPESVTSIVVRAFYNNQLTSIVIPEGVTEVGNRAFEDNQLTSIVLPSIILKMGYALFVNNQLSGEEAFIYNRNADGSINYASLNSYVGANRENVVIPNNVTSVGDYALSEIQLVSVVIPDNVTEIGDFSFFANQLTSIVIPNTVTSIGLRAFERNQLVSITIPESVISIGNSVFIDNPNLVKVVNKTGKSFDWNGIITRTAGEPFVTGTVGNVIISAS